MLAMALTKDIETEGEVIMMKGNPLTATPTNPTELVEQAVLYPFYTKQPTEKMNRLFNKYKDIFKDKLGDSLISVNQMGSGAIPGMVGSPLQDIIVAIKNYPPTEEQMEVMKQLNFVLLKGGKAPHDPNDTWLCSTDFPPGEDFDEFKINGKFPPEGHLGRVVIHLVQYSNPFVVRAQTYVEYLKSNEDAFKRYRDCKLEGARLSQSDASETTDAFIKYKIHKRVVVNELLTEALQWKERNGIQFQEELIQ